MKYAALILALASLIAVGCQSGSSDANAPATTAGADTQASNAPTAGSTSTGYAAVQETLNNNCIGCHGADNPKHGVNLTSFDAVTKGDNEGPIIDTANPEKSRLLEVCKPDGKPHMPPKGQLTDDQMKGIEEWIKAGAKNG